MFILFIFLGRWQQHRAAEKELIVTQNQERSKRKPEPLDLGRTEYESLRYLPVRISGKYDGDHQFLLDNQIKNHKVGYNVLTPVIVKGSEKAVLVDRGWVVQGLTRQLHPDISIESTEMNTEGQVYVPFSKGFRLGGLDDGEFLWPRVIQFLDFDAMSERLGYDLLPVVIRFSPKANNGYLRQWNIVNMGPERHLGYAFQWYALAVAMLGVLLVLALKKKSNL
jgi:surfeit locus 1 family protein